MLMQTLTLWPLFAALRFPIMRGSEAPAACEEYPRRVLEGVCRGEAASSEIADELQRHGVCICSSGLDIATILRAREEILALHAGGGLLAGRMSSEVLDHAAWRSDSIAWLAGGRKESAPYACELDAAVNAICAAVGRALKQRDEMVLTSRHDAQMAVFPGGGSCFKRHCDTKDMQGGGRKMTVVLYLNEMDWSAGGALRIHTMDSSAPPDVQPTAGTLVFMRSDMPHEVLPCFAPRVALTVWLDGTLLPGHKLYQPASAPLPAAPAPMRLKRKGLLHWWPFGCR